MAVFLDIAAAFDTIKPDHIRKSLLDKEVDGKLVEWYCKYITERHLTLESDEYVIKTCVGTGFPQGGVCSAKFWIIAFDPAIEILNEGDLFGQGFADDCAVLIGGEDLHYMTLKMNAALAKLVAWGATCGLRFNPNKTVLLHYKNNSKRKQTCPGILMDGLTITPSKHTRYLGVEIDYELNWKHHISTKIDKCRNLMAIISPNVRHQFGPKPKLVRWAYTGVIRPKLLYACQAWANKLTVKQIKCMKRLDRQTTTAMAPIRRSSPQASMEIIFDLTPIELLIEQLGTASFIRTRAHLQPFTNSPKGHLNKWAHIVDQLNLPMDTDKIENTTTINRPYNANIVSLSNDTKKYIGHSEYTAYTDGSKIDGKTGAGIIIYKLANNTVKSETVHRTIGELSQLGYDIPRLTLTWIKAHVGYEGNEMADLAAKQGAQEPDMSIKIDVPISTTEISNKLKELINNKWMLRWTTSTDYVQTLKEISGKTKPSPSQKNPTVTKTKNKKTSGNPNRPQQPKLLPIQSRPR